MQVGASRATRAEPSHEVAAHVSWGVVHHPMRVGAEITARAVAAREIAAGLALLHGFFHGMNVDAARSTRAAARHSVISAHLVQSLAAIGHVVHHGRHAAAAMRGRRGRGAAMMVISVSSSRDWRW